jgi:hypothetical protein
MTLVFAVMMEGDNKGMYKKKGIVHKKEERRSDE